MKNRRLIALFVLLAALLVVKECLPYKLVFVDGTSMTPTYSSWQPALIDCAYYRHHSIKRGDVIVFRLGSQALIKRVDAIAGDSVWSVNFKGDDPSGNLFVPPDKVARYERLVARFTYMRLHKLVVLPGTVFVLGDNLNVSIDSRRFGPVPLNAVLGKVIPQRPLARAQ